MAKKTCIQVTVELVVDGEPTDVLLDNFDDAPLSVKLAVAQLQSAVMFELLRATQEN